MMRPGRDEAIERHWSQRETDGQRKNLERRAMIPVRRRMDLGERKQP